MRKEAGNKGEEEGEEREIGEQEKEKKMNKNRSREISKHEGGANGREAIEEEKKSSVKREINTFKSRWIGR